MHGAVQCELAQRSVSLRVIWHHAWSWHTTNWVHWSRFPSFCHRYLTHERVLILLTRLQRNSYDASAVLWGFLWLHMWAADLSPFWSSWFRDYPKFSHLFIPNFGAYAVHTLATRLLMQHSNDCCFAVNIDDETTWTFRSVNRYPDFIRF